MTDDQAQTIPLVGSTLVKGGGFEAEFKWYTVGDVAFVRHAIHSARDLTPEDVDAFGKTLARVADALAEQGVKVRYGVERPLADDEDPVGAAVADAAGLVAAPPVRVLRRRLPIDAGDPVRGGGETAGRPADADADAAAWSALAGSLPDFPTRANDTGLVLEANDFATVVDGDDRSRLLACCWARTMPPAAAGSPTTTEIIAVGVDESADADSSVDLRRAVVLAMADLVSDNGVRTLAISVGDDDPMLSEAVEGLGFVPRRSRQQYVRSSQA